MENYKKASLLKEKVSFNICSIKSIQNKADVFVKNYSNLLILEDYQHSNKYLNELKHKVHIMSSICSKVEVLKASSSLCSLLLLYCKAEERVKNNRKILNSVSIADTNTLFVLQQYLLKQKEIIANKDSLSKIECTLNGVLESIKEVGICPLCKQSLCNCL